MRIHVKETPEISGIICLHGTSNPLAAYLAGLMPGAPTAALDPCNGADVSVQKTQTEKGVSPGPNLQILQSDHFYFT